MLGQFFGNEKITKLAKGSSTVVSLPAGSVLKLGGLGSQLKSNLVLDTSIIGTGGVENAVVAHELYYVYVIISGVTEFLIATTSEIKPLAFNAYRKIGVFYTDTNADITDVLVFGSGPRNLSCVVGLNANFNVLTAVNVFPPLDKTITDTANMHINDAVLIPESAMYTLAAQTQVFSISGIQRHSFKIRTNNLANIAISSDDIPVANNRYQQVVPAIDVFIEKNDVVLLNVDSTSDANYFLEAADNTTFLSVSKKSGANDINWNHN